MVSISKSGVRMRRSKALRVLAHGLFSVFLFSVSISANPNPEDFSLSPLTLPPPVEWVAPDDDSYSLPHLEEGASSHHRVHAYAQKPLAFEKQQISTAHTLTLQSLSDDYALTNAVRESLVATVQMPYQHRALLNFDFDFLELVKVTTIANDQDQTALAVTDINGLVQPDNGVWLDNTIEGIAARVDAFFKLYKSEQGQLDFVALDYSGLDFSIESLKETGAQLGSVLSYLQTIEDDVRFAEIQRELGFSDLSVLLDVGDEADQKRHRWNAVMQQRVAAYLNDAFYDPVKQHFPDARVLGRDYFVQAKGISSESQRFAVTSGAAVGNAQSILLTNIHDFPAFRSAVDQIRSMTMASDKPVYPFVTTSAENTPDWYQEVLLHAGLSGVSKFVYKNTQSVDADDELLAATLAELDQQMGVNPFAHLLDSVSLDDDFVFTLGHREERGSLGRFTPNLNGSHDTQLLVEDYPAKFTFNNTSVTLPNARVNKLESPVSRFGVWLEEAEYAPGSSTCLESLSIGRTCLAAFNGVVADFSEPTLVVEKSATAPIDESGKKQVLFARDWRAGGADAGLGKVDGFSVRYAANIDVEGGDYRFILKADDSVRLWIDDEELLVDGKTDSAVAERELQVTTALTAGQHQLRVEYTDIEGAASLSLIQQRIPPACVPDAVNTCLSLIDDAGELVIGAQQVTQSGNSISFNFDDFAFPADIDGDGLLMRWEGVIQTNAGAYDFNIAHGAGAVKIWVDDELLYQSLDGLSDYSGKVRKLLEAGTHSIRVELQAVPGSFFTITWDAAVADCTAAPANAFCGEFFDNVDLEGAASKTHLVSAIDFDWGRTAPFEGFNNDYFSARWVGQFFFEEGSYTFRPVTDDGVRLWIDGQLIVDYWNPQSAKERPASVRLAKGSHSIKMEYYERTGSAIAQLTWEKDQGCDVVPEGSFCGEYYDNVDLVGPVVLVRNDATLNFDWGKGSPDEAVSNDRFSIRWLGDFQFEGGDYNLNLNTDDGVRVWVGDQQVFDSWGKGGTNLQTFTVPEGKHRVHVEYREWGGNARSQISWTKAQPCSVVPEGRFCGDYFANTDLEGLPVYNRDADKIAFNWGKESPVPDVIPVDRFSVRWQGDHDFAAGKYNFDISSDDGVRLWVGDSETPLIDSWDRGGNFHAELELPAGKHRVRVEYREWGNAARINVGWTKGQFCEELPVGEFCGEYFANNTFTGFPVYKRNDANIAFDWNRDAPIEDVLPTDQFGVRWQGYFELEEGDYRFVARADDIMRVWINDELVIDQIKYNGNKEVHHDLRLAAGKHLIKMEMAENYGHARAHLFWEQRHDCSDVPTGEFCGSYYNGTSLAGDALRTERTSNIDFSWDDVRPMHGVPNNSYSVRWEGKFNFEEGYYRFSGKADDGIRIWIDEQQILDEWSRDWKFDGKVEVTPWVSAGEHTIKVEYRERWGNAEINVDWQPVSECAAVPQDAFCVEYFGNKKLEGLPRVVEKVNAIANAWEYEQPHPMVWKDQFSARWKGKHYFNAGYYRFTTSTDDGVKLFIDGNETISNWRTQGEKAYHQVVKLEQGWHELQMEYFDNGGRAAAHLSWQPLPSCDAAPEGKFCGEFFNNREFDGVPVDILEADVLDFDYEYSAPTDYVNRDKFSARWKGVFDFGEGGLYRFLTDHDDSLRIKLDGELIVDGWKRKWPYYGELRQLQRVTPGKHTVEVEFKEDWGKAKSKVWWEKAPDCENDIPDGRFCASFFDGIALDEGELLDTRLDDAINFNWQAGYPYEGANVPRDRFSVRWVGQFDFLEGEHTFNIRTDDGFRLWIDDELLIDSWKLQGSTPYSTRLLISEGKHTVKAEYYENYGHAVAEVNWQVDQANIPATPVNLAANDVTQERVGLSWDAQELVSSYRIMRDGEVLGTVSEASFADDAVTVTQTHVYQVIAIWSNGRESNPAEIQVTIPDTDAPTKPLNLSVESVSPNSVTLDWDESSDNVEIAGYKVFRGGEEITQVASNGVVDEGLSGFSQHGYYVIAFDAAGNESPASDTLTVFTKDDVGPTVPGSVSAKVVVGGQVELSWSAARDNVGVASYAVVRNNVRIGTSSQTRYVDATAQENTSYEYQIIAVDSSGNESAPTSTVKVISGDTTAPSAPQGLEASVPDGKSISLTWAPAIDNKAVMQYKVLRDGRLLGIATLPRYVDQDVEDGHSYQYSVKALDAAGNVSLGSSIVEASLTEICSSTELFFQQHVASTMAGNCATCHTAGGMAQTTQLMLSTGENAADANLHMLNSLTQRAGKDYILNKASANGVVHGGSTALPKDSSEWADLSELLVKLESPGACSDQGGLGASHILTDSLANNCASCHGTNGQSAGPATPTIAGMSSAYLEGVMADYQSGARASTVMNRIAKGYTAAEIREIATVFAQQPYVVAKQTVDAGLALRGGELHTQYCASCHTAGGRDNSLGARLAGQWQPYLEQTLQDYAAGRSQMPIGMQDNLESMFAANGDDGIKALAAFYASATEDTQAPDKPEDLSVAAYTTSTITLTWTDADDDWGLAYYEIYRDGVLVGTTQFNTFTDIGLLSGDYRYTVVAVDIAGHKSVVSDGVLASLVAENVSPDGVQLLDYASTLRKASLVLLGRLPTNEELASVETEESFRTTLRSMMDASKALDQFAYRTGHEVFLSRGAARANSNEGIHSDDFPALMNLTDEESGVVRDAIREEPVYLLQHIVDADRPWTEILTADYTVLNPQLAKALGAVPTEGAYTDTSDATERRPAKVGQLSSRLPVDENKAFPHAGVLSMNAWLSRFPTTDTNRNRHRSAEVFKQFLAVDIEALAQRPLDDSDNGNYLVPTMENPNCMVCHTVMEPVAGAFRNWGDDNRYAQNFNGTSGDKDSLDRSYKSNNYPLNHVGQPWHHDGDLWYRDMFMPGMNDKVMPGGYTAFGETTLTTSANLLVNPSAEEGLAGWTVITGAMEAVNQSQCDRVSAEVRNGTFMFQLGQCAVGHDEVVAQQNVNISEHAEDIDQGDVKIEFGAYLRSRNGRDTPSVQVSFLNAAGEVIAESEVLEDRRTWSWRNRTAEQDVPADTRTLRFTLRGQRSGYRWADEYIDAYVDDAFMMVKTPTRNVVASDGTTDSLQWLAKQLIRDQRFAKGGVHFWYRSLFKRDPLAAPVDPDADGYVTAMATFKEQDTLLEDLADRFSRDHGNGVWNVKDLLIDMVASPLFRANRGVLSSAEEQAVSDIGLARLLVPEELNRKLKAVTGYEWRPFQETRAWSDRAGLFYGGFDGGSLQESPNTEMNSMMSKIPERMAIELSCNMVRDDFRKAVTERGLFQFVEQTDTPAYEDVNETQMNMLLNPGAEDGLTGWVVETGNVRVLSGARGCDGGPSIKTGSSIFNPGSICKDPTELARLYQDVNISAWAEQIDLGDSNALFGAALRGWSNNNDEASVYLSFRDASGIELGSSDFISSTRGYWESPATFASVPVGTRVIRFYMQGRRLSTHVNNDAFVDDTYLRLLLPDSNYMPAGERRIRENIQFLHKRFLNEDLALDDAEIDRTFSLFSEVWADRSEINGTACRLYNDWEDPNYTKRAWSMVVMYLMTDARFLHE